MKYVVVLEAMAVMYCVSRLPSPQASPLVAVHKASLEEEPLMRVDGKPKVDWNCVRSEEEKEALDATSA